MNITFDKSLGNAKIAELDKLEHERIAEIRNTPNTVSHSHSGAVYYVSPNGNDALNGRTPKSAVRTISRAIGVSKQGDAILLERGGCWREKIVVPEGRTISAYGEGRKPIISGSPEDGSGAEKWTLDYADESGKKIWRFYNDALTDVGAIFFDGDGNFNYKGFARKQIPNVRFGKYTCRENPEREFDYREELENMTLFHKWNTHTDCEIIPADSAVGSVFLRCDKGNPGELFRNIEFNTRGHNITVRGNNVTIDNLCIVHTGGHGIGAGTVENLTVTNCEIGWIGGSLQNYRKDEYGSFIRYGNGIQVFGGCKGYTIENCYVYQCYDAGITHQYSIKSKGDCFMNDVLYRNNVITDCVYCIEYFLSETEEYRRSGENVLFEGNLLRRAGFGFGSTRHNTGGDGCIRSGGKSNNPFKNFVIRSNILDRSTTFLVQCSVQAEEYIPKMVGNTYIQGVGNRLCHFGLDFEKVDVDENTESYVKNLLCDEEADVYCVDFVPKYVYEIYEGQ